MNSVAGTEEAAGLFAVRGGDEAATGAQGAAGVVSRAGFGNQSCAYSDQCIVITCLSRTITVRKITASSKYFSCYR